MQDSYKIEVEEEFAEGMDIYCPIDWTRFLADMKL
jgi:hypothetical protein